MKSSEPNDNEEKPYKETFIGNGGIQIEYDFMIKAGSANEQSGIIFFFKDGRDTIIEVKESALFTRKHLFKEGGHPLAEILFLHILPAEHHNFWIRSYALNLYVKQVEDSGFKFGESERLEIQKANKSHRDFTSFVGNRIARCIKLKGSTGLEQYIVFQKEVEKHRSGLTFLTYDYSFIESLKECVEKSGGIPTSMMVKEAFIAKQTNKNNDKVTLSKAYDRTRKRLGFDWLPSKSGRPKN